MTMATDNGQRPFVPQPKRSVDDDAALRRVGEPAVATFGRKCSCSGRGPAREA
jgi:hypothetical protein